MGNRTALDTSCIFLHYHQSLHGFGRSNCSLIIVAQSMNGLGLVQFKQFRSSLKTCVVIIHSKTFGPLTFNGTWGKIFSVQLWSKNVVIYPWNSQVSSKKSLDSAKLEWSMTWKQAGSIADRFCLKLESLYIQPWILLFCLQPKQPVSSWSPTAVFSPLQWTNCQANLWCQSSKLASTSCNQSGKWFTSYTSACVS